MLTNIGLVEHAKMALREGWGYVYGTIGQVLTEEILQYKMKQYPNNVPQYETFIRGHWLGKRTVDCVNLIKSYLWWNGGNIKYSSDIDKSADGTFQAATVKGTLDTIPEIPGLCVWRSGHIGVYIGNGQVIEAKGTKYGVVQTPLRGPGANTWTHWLQYPYIAYEEGLYIGNKGEEVKALQGKLNTIGYTLEIDGAFGPITQKAVISFQTSNGLEPHGVVDAKTMAAIDGMIEKLQPKKKTWKDIIKEVSSNPDEWENAINVAVNAANAEGDLGALEIFKYLPLLIEKVYAQKQNS